MELQIYRTQDRTKSYPHHSHNYWEILLYLEGTGYLDTHSCKIPFHPGTIILVPPEVPHGSVSESGFRNISIGGSFKNILFFDAPVCIEDNEDRDGTALALLLFKNRKNDTAYVNSLADAYIHFLLNRVQLEKRVNLIINEIITAISENFEDPGIDLSGIIGSYSYTKDYIRQRFKAATGMHPTEFLTKCRIDRACFLIEIYGNTVPLSQIAENCGYLDYVYFSKQFKACRGISPQEYRKKR